MSGAALAAASVELGTQNAADLAAWLQDPNNHNQDAVDLAALGTWLQDPNHGTAPGTPKASDEADDVILTELPPALSATQAKKIYSTSGRLGLLQALKSAGVDKLGQRQRLAGAVSRQHRNMRPPSPPPPPPPPPAPTTAVPSRPLAFVDADRTMKNSIRAASALTLSSAGPYTVALDDDDDDDDGLDDRERLLRRFDAFHQRYAWQRLEAVDHVWAISDLHTEVSSNRDWLLAVAPRPHDALVIGGDVSHDMEKLEWALRMLVGRFKYVFFVAGNHELWWHGTRDASSEDGATDSIAKLLYMYEFVHQMGAFAAPALLGDAANGDGVAVVGLQSWYHPYFLDGGQGPNLNLFSPGNDRGLQMARMMDAAVRWPRCLAEKPHEVGRDRARFFAEMNRAALGALTANPPAGAGGGAAAAVGLSPVAVAHDFGLGGPRGSSSRPVPRATSLAGWPVVSFSHFLPAPELHMGYRTLEHIEGSLDLRDQIRALHAAAGKGASPHVHCFGHTHFSIDRRIDGVRYVQHPLGNPHERRNGWQIHTSEARPFALVWSSPNKGKAAEHSRDSGISQGRHVR